MTPPTTLLDLRTVTLCCIDTRCPALAVRALRHCMSKARFARVLLFSAPHSEGLSQLSLEGIELVGIAPLRGIADYSHFMLKGLNEHVHSPHALVVQWDGFLVNPEKWQDAFLAHDYLGAPWVHGEFKGLVGNGGFSLRSKKLLQALARPEFSSDNPEDQTLCITHRPALQAQHGISFAPLDMAQAFSCERGPWQAAFGFHGCFNFPEFMAPAELSSWLQGLPDDMTGSNDARALVKKLMLRHDLPNARTLLAKRVRHLGWTRDHVLLWLRIGGRRLWPFKAKSLRFHPPPP